MICFILLNCITKKILLPYIIFAIDCVTYMCFPQNEFCACLAESSPVTSRRENGTGIRNKDAESSSSAAGHQNKPRGMIAGRCWSKFWHKVCDERAQTLDTISRGAFPGLFILFNILYWTLYTSAK